MQPWDNPIPPILYKYLRPERLDVLTDCHIRFSQRTAFDDDHELQPQFAAYGTEDEILRFMVSQGWPPRCARWFAPLFVKIPGAQELATRTAQKSMRSPNEFGVLCLTEVADSEQMWKEYADDERGFVLAFDTTHAGFERLRTPGRIGKVSYSDEPCGTFLGLIDSEGAGIFFRKRLKYSFEREWRSVRALQRLERRAGNIFLSSFDPESVRQIIISPNCALETELRRVAAADARYQHVQIKGLR